MIDFVDSDYTFLNGTLAALYGLEKTVTGPEMRKVILEDTNRGGILGMPGILATTSFPNRTSPVKRGVIDAAGELPGEKRFSSPRELKAIIAARKDELARNLTRKLLAYALCRQLEGYDEIVVDQLMVAIANDGYRMQNLISEIVTSYPFVNRRIHESEAPKSNGQ